MGENAVVGNIRPEIAKHSTFLFIGDIHQVPGNPQGANLLMHTGPGLAASELFSQRYNLEKTGAVILYTGGMANFWRQGTEWEFLPLQRGFLSSHAGLVLSFLWELDFESLGGLLKAMYSEFVSSNQISYKAIHKIQTQMIADPYASHPYFWAGILPYNLIV